VLNVKIKLFLAENSEEVVPIVKYNNAVLIR